MFFKNNILYSLSFIAGGVLLASELLMAKLISPYFGTSFYVWAATIGATLSGLAVGYLFSGILSTGGQLTKKLILLFTITGFYLCFLPLIGSLVMNTLLKTSLITGIILSTSILDFPLFLLFGCFSPIIIQGIHSSDSNAGNVSGRIFGISTISGVLFLIITGVYLLPGIGTTKSFIVLGTLLFAAGLIVFFTKKKINA
jgi:hypothetical protein